MSSKHDTTTTSNQPDLLECDALMLSSYLLHHRFDGNAMDTASFLLEATSTLPNAESLSAQLMGGSQETQQEGDNSKQVEEVAAVSFDGESSSSSSKPVTSPATVSMTIPRGKFQMTILEKGLQCLNAKNQVFQIPPNTVERLVMFPKPEDCRKITSSKSSTSGDMVLLCLAAAAAIQFNGKAVKQVCFQLPSDTPVLVDGNNDNRTWLQLLCTSLGLDGKTQVARVHNPNSNVTRDSSSYSFKSHDEGTTSSTTAGMPFVQCYHGVKDGVLYPMQEGLLFFKPPLFLHRSVLHSIACGRGSGGSSRYVDLQLALDGDEQLEFTNIHRDELVHLNTYIHSILIPAMQRDAIVDNDKDKSDNGSTQQEDDKEQSSSANDDDEEEPSTLGKRKRTQRKASKEARLATKAHMEQNQDKHDSDDDDDDGWEGGLQQDEEEDDSDDDDDGELGEPERYTNNGSMHVDEEDDDDDDDEEEFFEEEDSGTATESDDDGE